MADSSTRDGFVHLHVHSHYSLLDGSATVENLVGQVAEHNSPAMALTDHGNMFGAMDLCNSAKKAGIKPIVGLEAYISPTTRQDRSMGNQQTACYHMVLLAMNNIGFKNLRKLSSRAFIEGFYYKPRVDRTLLSEFNEGLVCTTACLGGEVPSALLGGDYQKALKIASEYRDIFGKDRFFIEVQNQGLDDQTRINPDLVKIANHLGVGLVGTNDVHFLRPDDKEAHEVLCCVSMGRTLEDSRQAAENGRSKMQYPPTLYLRSPAEMRQMLKEFHGACDNTLKIAEMCNLDLDESREYLPVFPVPEGKDDNSYLRELAEEGLKNRFDGREIPEEYTQRLNRELEIISDKGYSSYFLICRDFVQHAREQEIPASPRGSGLSSLLCYALRIAEIDPLKYGLLFERFTDPQRQEAPDLDIDMCQEGRGEILRYVRQKYGHVAQIITYGTLKARAVLKDVGRVLGHEAGNMDKLTAKIPSELKMTLDKALAQEPDLQKLYNDDPAMRNMFDFGKQLEGLCRHVGVHAAGVIIADFPLDDVVPLCTQSGAEDVITQWDGPTCEKVGLMKMDFLGLRTLTTLQRARKLVFERTGNDLDPETLPLDDKEVYRLFQSGNTDGVFQFESDGMKGILKQIQPEVINDLIAANAMYRPGPMELIPSYCNRKHGREKVTSVHPLVDDILAETYGIMAYQEQVMLVLNRLGKLPLNRALTLIKAISKKKEKVIASEKPNFMNGAKENGISESEGETLFDLILKFAGYGFNKSHSTRYAILAYQTAYFKVHYPREFMAATLTFECDDTDKVVKYMGEARRMNIQILPPDINACGSDFTIDEDSIRFGLAAVKGVGHSAVDAILSARQETGTFKNLYHFCEYIDHRRVNKSTVEALIKCGAFDSLGAHRAAMIATVEKALEIGSQAAIHRRSGQMNLFGQPSEEDHTSSEAKYPDVEPWSDSRLLKEEKETLGFYISSHPLVKYGRELASLSRPKGASLGNLASDMEKFPNGIPVRVGCTISSVRHTFTKKKGEKMAMITLEDITGKLDAVVFPKTFKQIEDQLIVDNMLFMTGKIDRTRNQPQIIVEQATAMDKALEQFTGSVVLRLPANSNDEMQSCLLETIRNHHGSCQVMIETHAATRPDLVATIKTGTDYCVTPSRDLINTLEDILGDQDNVLFVAREVKLQKNGRKNWKDRF